MGTHTSHKSRKSWEATNATPCGGWSTLMNISKESRRGEGQEGGEGEAHRRPVNNAHSLLVSWALEAANAMRCGNCSTLDQGTRHFACNTPYTSK